MRDNEGSIMYEGNSQNNINEYKKNKMSSKKREILVIFILFLLAILILAINKYRNWKLEKEGKYTKAIFLRIDPYFKGGPYINYYYIIKGDTIYSTDQQQLDEDRNLKAGDIFHIKYLPNSTKSKIIRNNRGRIIMYKDCTIIKYRDKIK